MGSFLSHYQSVNERNQKTQRTNTYLLRSTVALHTAVECCAVIFHSIQCQMKDGKTMTWQIYFRLEQKAPRPNPGDGDVAAAPLAVALGDNGSSLMSTPEE